MIGFETTPEKYQEFQNERKKVFFLFLYECGLVEILMFFFEHDVYLLHVHVPNSKDK